MREVVRPHAIPLPSRQENMRPLRLWVIEARGALVRQRERGSARTASAQCVLESGTVRGFSVPSVEDGRKAAHQVHAGEAGGKYLEGIGRLIFCYTRQQGTCTAVGAARGCALCLSSSSRTGVGQRPRAHAVSSTSARHEDAWNSPRCYIAPEQKQFARVRTSRRPEHEGAQRYESLPDHMSRVSRIRGVL